MLKVVRYFDEPEEQKEGLRLLKLQPQECVVFRFTKPQSCSFWNVGVDYAISLAFLDTNMSIIKLGALKPHQAESLLCNALCHMVIEALPDVFIEPMYRPGDKLCIEHGEIKHL